MKTQTQSPVRPSPWKRLHFMAPLLFVNLLALIGQSIWTYHKLKEVFLYDHHKIALAFAILMGLTLESIGTYLSLQAHSAVMADQASGGLRIAAYSIGAVMAGLNFTHFNSAPTDSASLGIMFALASLCSPWLWSVESKAAHRAQLADRGVVDPRGVKLSTVRKIFHPVRSLKVASWASWAGEMDPARAVRGWESVQSIPQSGKTEQLTATIGVVIPEPVHVPALPQSTPVPAIESAAESVTETVTETVTRTRTQTRSRTEARIQTLAERVDSVRAHPDYVAAAESQTELSYDQIGAIIGRTGRGVIGPVFQVLYRGQSVESVILGIEA